MFKKGLIVAAALCVVGTFVACERQNSEAAVSDSVAEASEKQMSPESSTTGQAGESAAAPAPAASEAPAATPAAPATTTAPAAAPAEATPEASKVPSIEEKKVAPAAK